MGHHTAVETRPLTRVDKLLVPREETEQQTTAMAINSQSCLVALHNVAEGDDGRPDAALGPRRRAVRRPQPLQPLLLLHLELEGFQPFLSDLIDRGARLMVDIRYDVIVCSPACAPVVWFCITS